MTGSARRLPSGHARPRLSSETRAILAARRSTKARPRGRSVGRIITVLLLVVVVAATSVGAVTAMVGTQVLGSLAGGLPPADLDNLSFAQPTMIYDRTGKVELARFEREERRVVGFDEVPKLVLDTTTAAEDRTFWDNDGFDPAAIVAAVAQNLFGGSGERGASTITQQLVRARLLPTDLVQSGDKYARKVLEVLQASRLTAA